MDTLVARLSTPVSQIRLKRVKALDWRGNEAGRYDTHDLHAGLQRGEM